MPPGHPDERERLTRRLAREREIRLQAEAIAERGLRELYEKQLQLEFLARIATMANQSGSVLDVLASALAVICAFNGWPVAHAYLLAGPAEAQRMWPTDIWHVDPALDLTTFRLATSRRIFGMGEGLPGQVWAAAAPVWIADLAAASDRFPRLHEASADGLRAAFAIPLMIETEVVGVLEFFATETKPADTALLQIMAQAGTQLGRVIERDRANDRLHDALHDALTGLPNRANFLRRLEQAVRECRVDEAHAFCVLFIDLDAFKVINDSLGHLAGDELLIQVAARLRASIRESDLAIVPATLSPRASSAAVLQGTPASSVTVDASHSELVTVPQAGCKAMLARLGGDEFTVLLRGISDPAVATRIAERIHQALRHPFLLDNREVVTSASIGIALGTASHGSADEVLRDADLAMYQAKARGKARSELFDTVMHASAMQRISLESDLRAALRDQAFTLHYQPIVSLADERIVGFEALVRWEVAPGVLRYPGDFIGVAEETGLIVPLGLWALRQACLHAQRWNQAFPAAQKRTMSVNLSARQFTEPDLVEQVGRIIAQTGMEPATLRLEITETVAMEDADRAIQVLSGLRALGVLISIDDFGTGFSCLSYLHRFPLQVLKIDRSFISRMESNSDSLQIVKTILNLASSLGMKVIAEGAETEAEILRLRQLGCDYCQGYFFSPPLDVAAVEDLLGSGLRPRSAIVRSAVSLDEPRA